MPGSSEAAGGSLGAGSLGREAAPPAEHPARASPRVTMTTAERNAWFMRA
jgi:hypothetical protein